MEKQLAPQTSVHPLDQLTVAECKKAVSLLRREHQGKSLHIKNVQAQEPPKKLMTRYLDALHSGPPVAPPPRVAYCIYYVLEDRVGEEMWLNLESESVVQRRTFPKGSHPPLDFNEILPYGEKLLKEKPVIEALKKCGVTDELMKCVAPDGWIYGCDTNIVQPRYVMFLMYMRDAKTNNADSNIYSFPLPFVPVYDLMEQKLARVDWCATGGDGDDVVEINYNTRNPMQPLVETLRSSEYMSELRPELPLRQDIKPYHVVQPEGPSFSVEGSRVRWQKWDFRVGFNAREGLVIHDVRYDGRQTFYRLSVSEMTVPYGDPRPPLHRKQAFDLGDLGAGYCANSLALGCDCLGTIKYFDGHLVHGDGQIEVRKNVICMHEQDDGILYKHTNYRTNVPRVARRRILILQTVLTVANYEYIFAWHFDQAANVELEIRATGIVSTQYIDPGKKSKWGTVVAPSVLAASHQHIFSMRIDPAVDGHNNTIAVCDTKLDRRDQINPHGTGFYNSTSYVEKSSAFDADQTVNRYIKIVNENKINPITMSPVGYKLSAVPSALLLAPEGTICRSRAQFATHHFWVTKHVDDEFFAGGVWTNQAAVELGGVQDAVNRNEHVRNEDVVLWHSFGLTHHPRAEDFPVMPVERLTVGLHPNGFFTENPAMDVPPSNQKFNRSVEVMDTRCCNKI
ncbi:Copper amine oxidase 1 [Wickerhamiella sorbophila]|uniref:Amine oxidase n=1 Tax=Wickerhamiella sorbophila TaxID=45607 RepID=A0A2T0FET6_9ASCO|nr:Copper amine oxidase 1 [Wickerhamiella sorbophila]PRT53512.1 Copper amine oxidase 1 [Wickerhamiella sorbophila]